MAKLMFYENPVPLDKNTHKNLRVKQSDFDFTFAQKVHSVILAEVEFMPASRDYPIVFTRTEDGRVVPIALLGVRDAENLFVTNGKWRPNTYIPAFVRRYPFIPAEADDEKLTVCIDDKYAGFSLDAGEPLFDEQGEPASLLNQAIALMQDYHAECKRTEQFTRMLGDLNLFKEVSIQIEMKDGTRFALSGVLMIDETKWLKEVKCTDVWDLYIAGHLPSIYAHLFSQANLARLVDLVAERRPIPEREKAVRPTKSGRADNAAASKESATADA